MTPAEDIRAGLATAIAGLRFAEAGAVRQLADALFPDLYGETPEVARERLIRIKQTRQAMEWEQSQAPTVPDAPDVWTGVTPWPA